MKKHNISTYEKELTSAGFLGLGLLCAEPISVFKVKGQVNAKEGVKIYTTQSAFLRVLLKKLGLPEINHLQL